MNYAEAMKIMRNQDKVITNTLWDKGCYLYNFGEPNDFWFVDYRRKDKLGRTPILEKNTVPFGTAHKKFKVCEGVKIE